MNELEFIFALTPLEALLQTKKPGDAISAAQVLTLLEGESEEVWEDALQALEENEIVLDISSLPKAGASGEAALRLRQEMQMVQKGLQTAELEENDPLRLFLEEVSENDESGDEEALAEQCAEGNERAMQCLTNLGLPLVLAMAKQHVGYGVLLMDLIQEGSLGLWQAICTYAGGSYQRYRDQKIAFYMAKAVILQARSNGVGQKMRTALEDYQSVDQRLLGDLGRNPTLEEIALELHMTVEEGDSIRKMLEDARILAKVTQVPEEQTQQQEDSAVEDTALFQMRQRISELLSELSQEDAKLLSLRFGLEGGKALSPEQAGKLLGLTPDEVLAREAAALGKLRTGK